MEDCPAVVTAQTEEEVWKLMELHAAIAHGEDSKNWDEETKTYLRSLIKHS